MNFALAVDYELKTVALYHSIGRLPLAQVVPPTNSSMINQANWHVGAYRLPLDGGTQLLATTGLYYSLIWVERDQVTTRIV
jgi:hypothetical protein